MARRGSKKAAAAKAPAKPVSNPETNGQPFPEASKLLLPITTTTTTINTKNKSAGPAVTATSSPMPGSNASCSLSSSTPAPCDAAPKLAWNKRQRQRVREQRAQKMMGATDSRSSNSSSGSSGNKSKSTGSSSLGKKATKYPELLPKTLSETFLLTAAMAVGSIGFYVPYSPGSVAFFFAQAAVWAASTTFFCLFRQLSWERTFPFNGGEPPKWRESMPAWAFEASALIQIAFYVPGTLVMIFKIVGSVESIQNSYKLIGEDYTDGVWMEHFMFSSLFGFMIRDFVLHVKRPDPLLTLHHIAVCLMMVGASFFAIRGFRLLALILPIVELGSCAYCYWCIHRWLRFYAIFMTFSNIAWAVGCCLCTFPNDYTYFQLFLLIVVFAMVAGRQLVMLQEIRT